MTTDSKRKEYIDYLRTLATLAVVLIHVSAVNWYSSDINGYEWNIFNIYNSSVRWAVPVFVMISGALLLDRDITLGKIATKCLHLMVIFVVWSFLYACFIEGSINNKIAAFFLGHYHMWFIFTICGLYLTIPFYRLIVRSRYVYYYLILAGLFTIIIPEILSSLTGWGGKKAETFSNILKTDLDYVNIQMVLGYSIYFVLGHIIDLSQIERREWINRILYIGMFVGVSITILGTYAISKHNNVADSHYYYYFSPNVFISAICVFAAFKIKPFINGNHLGLVKNVSRYCFGIYLSHPLVIEMSKQYLNVDTLSFNPLISVPVISFYVFVVSYVITYTLSHIPVIGKWVV